MTSQRDELHRAIEETWTLCGRPSMRSLGDATGVSHSTLHSAITGRTMPTRPTLDKLLDALKVTEGERARIVGLHNLVNDRRHSPATASGVAYLILTDGEVHDVVINDEPMAFKQAQGQKAVLVALPIMHDFRERE